MRIQRNHSKPFFSRRRHFSGSMLFAVGLLVGIFVVVVMAQFDKLQLAALAAVGMAPTTTPFASTNASLAVDRYTAGDVVGAADLFAQAVREQPDNVSYLYEYGKLLIELDKSAEAVPLADRAMQVAPNDPRGYALKARALMWNDPTSAIPVATNGLEVNPNFSPLHSALAIAYTNIGRYQEGLVRAQKAIELDPMDGDAHYAYSFVLVYVGRYQQAIDELEQQIALNPNLTGPYFELAGLYRRIKQEKMAVAVYQHILTIDPKNAKAYQRMCATYVAVGEFQQAEPFCDQALDIDPNYADAYQVLGQLQYARRNYEGSIESFKKCVDLGSTAIECWYLRGLAYYFLADSSNNYCSQAWDILSQSLQMAQADATVPEGVKDNIRTGLTNITVRCEGYANHPLPTVIPPTGIPPTPIGGGG